MEVFSLYQTMSANIRHW